MIQLLERAFTEISKLPPLEQNHIAQWLLDELVSEKIWEEYFANSQNQLEQLASEALLEHKNLKTN